jgi:hypothetical protein
METDPLLRCGCSQCMATYDRMNTPEPRRVPVIVDLLTGVITLVSLGICVGAGARFGWSLGLRAGRLSR